MGKQKVVILQDNQSSELATFSFDGDNANKIVINSKYDYSQIRVAYSLDGGNKWKETNDHIIALTQEELNSMNEEVVIEDEPVFEDTNGISKPKKTIVDYIIYLAIIALVIKLLSNLI